MREIEKENLVASHLKGKKEYKKEEESLVAVCNSNQSISSYILSQSKPNPTTTQSVDVIK